MKLLAEGGAILNHCCHVLLAGFIEPSKYGSVRQHAAQSKRNDEEVVGPRYQLVLTTVKNPC